MPSLKRWPLLTVPLRYEQDVVSARQRAKQVAQQLGFETQDQIRVATAVSEVARNAFVHARGGKIEFFLEDGPYHSQVLLALISDEGPGIANLAEVLDGSASLAGASALGLVGARRLVDSFHVESHPGQGTTVTIRKARPQALRPIDQAQLQEITAALYGAQPRTAIDELRQQNQELLTALEALERNQQELVRLNQELEDTNRGVVALYAELDEKAKELHQANQVKSRFLAHMSHEFRTPLNSVLALSRLLLGHADGDLSEEQTKQVVFIRRAAGELLEMVNDLLDLAKVEAGTMPVQPSEVNVQELMSALRGMFLPLVTTPDVSLVFSGFERLPNLWVDERKLTQILRNFIGNALKFTTSGEVRVTAELDERREHVCFSVKDTGIGIAREDQEHIFDEFRQLSGPAQKTMGSGLGLAISRKLADIMGAAVGVDSEPGQGSTFWLRLPADSVPASVSDHNGTDEERVLASRMLIVDDNEIDRYILKGLLTDLGHEAVEASDGEEGLQRTAVEHPEVIFLDLMMPGVNGFQVLERLREEDATSTIGVVVVTSKSLDAAEKKRLRELRAAFLPKSTYSTGNAGVLVRAALEEALAWRKERAS